jgi:hypothetical protein
MLRQSFFIAALALCAQQAAAAEAGKIIFVAGSAQLAEKSAQQGAAVQEGALLSTGADGYIYVKTVDNGLFILRPNTKARIAAYHVDRANPSNTRVKLELLGGVVRSQSGEAVKQARQNFRFNTPVAAIGVRGTDFTVFADRDTSRVAVVSGAITMSGFGGSCSPDGSGPCEGATARELSAGQKGQLLQVSRGQTAPQLLQSGALAPDVLVPPRADEPVAKSGTTEPSLEPLKVGSLAVQVQLNTPPSVNGPGNEKPPVVTPPPVVETGAPYKEISWGRWQAVADMAANVGLSKPGADRIGIAESYVLFRDRTGLDYVQPERGTMGFSLASSEASVRDTQTQQRSAATVENGQLMVDFGAASFTTSFDAVHQGERFKLATTGTLGKDGVFSSAGRAQPTNNMTVTGALNGNNAAYVFQSLLNERKAISGITSWTAVK